MQLSERRIESAGRTLVVLEGGDPAGAPARGIRLIGYSRPGCGGSTRVHAWLLERLR